MQARKHPKMKSLSTMPGNRFLARLPDLARNRLMSLMQPVALAFEQVIYKHRSPMEYAYFPIHAALSALAIMEDGRAIEVATIGNEGFIGYTAATNPRLSPNKVIVQIPGAGYRIEAHAFENELKRSAPLRNLVRDYQFAFMIQISQTVACNGLHQLEMRCCRWLLMSRDRTGSDELRLTHEYLGVMLGVRRASVSDALKPLQKAGLLRSHRGKITLLDRDGIEERACECYQVVKAEYDRLLGKTA